jgi:hypothetical protein
MQISDISQSIQELYLDAQAQVNQMRKFQKALEEVLGDEVQAELGLSDLLIEWRAILRDRKVQTTEQKVQTTEQKVQQDATTKATTEQKVQQDATTKATEQTTKATEQTTKATEQTTHSIKAQETKESVSQRESHLRTLTADLTNQLSSLTGWKPLSALIPDYETKLAQAEQELKQQGKDPKLAESVVLLSNEKFLIHAVHQYAKDSGKPLSEDDLKTLRSNFDSLRSSASELKLPAYSPASLALRDPQITPETYSKIKAGFEPPSQTVWPNPKTGEYVSQKRFNLWTGEEFPRTIMTNEWRRFREKAGLRIESPVPETNWVFEQAEQLHTARWNLSIKSKFLESSVKISSAELREKFPIDRYPNLKFPNLDPNATPEKAVQSLTEFYKSQGWRELSQANTPEIRMQAQFVDTVLNKYFRNIDSKDRLQKQVKELASKKPEFILQEKIRSQDSTIDDNLNHLTHIWVHHLGQETYQLLIDWINHKLQTQAIPPISDTMPLTPEQLTYIRKALLAVAGLDSNNPSVAYPDGKLSPEALVQIQKVYPTNAEKIDRFLANI